MTPHLLLEIVVDATSATQAEQMARIWAAAEPKIHLEKITRVRPAVMSTGASWHDKWSVELAYTSVETDQAELGL